MANPAGEAPQGERPWKVVEESDLSWSEAAPRYHFRFEVDPNHGGGGECTRLLVTGPGIPALQVDNSDGWVAFEGPDVDATLSVYKTLAKRRLGSSKFALIVQPTAREHEPPLAFIRSWGYASNAERLHVIGFGESGRPVVLLNEEFDLLQMADLDGDGYPELVGLRWLSETFGPGFASYDPPVVYKVPRPIGPPAVLDLALSEAYAREHYYGWVGLEHMDKFVVVLRPPEGGKPRILPRDEAERLMAGAQAGKGP